MKDELEKWTENIEEISNCVWKVNLTHELGAKIEKIGTNLEQLLKEVKESAIKMNKQIEGKIKTTHNNGYI